ncbi:CUGBP Elav-like family member 4 [Triplophysa tibetana]|uniref:CUGBP Elav-like family member 4 n=1 Tax=Triplophysa tibetana TaxID=1572043 RepID=A0A5A9P3K8_9TELE|nr:CUGBP Elav-like family member 4 [Triplophysa tibetana]
MHPLAKRFPSNQPSSPSNREKDRRAVICLFTTCRRSSATLSSCRCFCLLATSFPPKSLWTGPPIRASVLVS